MDEALALEYEGRGFAGSIDLSAWLSRADGDDVAALMGMRAGMPWDDAPRGLRDAYGELAGEDAHSEPHTLAFGEQSLLLERLRRDHPLLWEAASGCALRCGDTADMFGDGS
jgi:hypothetical protein